MEMMMEKYLVWRYISEVELTGAAEWLGRVAGKCSECWRTENDVCISGINSKEHGCPCVEGGAGRRNIYLGEKLGVHFGHSGVAVSLMWPLALLAGLRIHVWKSPARTWSLTSRDPVRRAGERIQREESREPKPASEEGRDGDRRQGMKRVWWEERSQEVKAFPNPEAPVWEVSWDTDRTCESFGFRDWRYWWAGVQVWRVAGMQG